MSRGKRDRRSGFTFVEILVSAALLGIFGGVVVSAITEFDKQRTQVLALGSKDIQISGLVDNIRSNLKLFQSSHVTHGSTVIAEADRLMPDKKDLPLAWSLDGAITSPASCPTCDGRLGYVIQPSGTSPGLYVVTMRVYHPRLEGGAASDYQFLVNFND